MTDGPLVVGINRTQDGSIAVTLGGSTMFSLRSGSAGASTTGGGSATS